jgi:hypothetical protein
MKGRPEEDERFRLLDTLDRIFRHRVQRRIRGHATPDVWFEVE